MTPTTLDGYQVLIHSFVTHTHLTADKMQTAMTVSTPKTPSSTSAGTSNKFTSPIHSYDGS
jgi:hypothetical protein